MIHNIDGEQEMTLEQCVEKLPLTHRARKELAALQLDKKRLDWLDENQADVDYPGEDDGVCVIIYTATDPFGSGAGSGLTIRAAADNAMKKTNENTVDV